VGTLRLFLPAPVVVVVIAMATKNNKPDITGVRRASVAFGMETCTYTHTHTHTHNAHSAAVRVFEDSVHPRPWMRYFSARLTTHMHTVV